MIYNAPTVYRRKRFRLNFPISFSRANGLSSWVPAGISGLRLLAHVDSMATKKRNNFIDEVRRIESKMYPPDTIGAGMARFDFDNEGLLDFLLATTQPRLSRGE
jgi:hypothetical protein